MKTFIFDNFKDQINESFDVDQFVVSKDLMESTLKAIENNESSHISQAMDEQKASKSRRVKIIQRGVVIAASFMILIIGMQFIGSLSRADKSSEKMGANQIALDDASYEKEEKATEESEEGQIVGASVMFDLVCFFPEEEIATVAFTKGENLHKSVSTTENVLIEKTYKVLEELDWNRIETDLRVEEWSYKLVFYGLEDEVCIFYIGKERIQVENIYKQEKTVEIYEVGDYTELIQRLDKIHGNIIE
jgi:hypothetical protein